MPRLPCQARGVKFFLTKQILFQLYNHPSTKNTEDEMKKLAILIMSLTASCLAFIALNGKASADTATASGVYADGTSSINLEYDADGDKINDSLLVVTLEKSGGIATINKFFTRAVNVTVPDKIKVNFTSGTQEFYPMLLNYIYPENGQTLQSVKVPDCVKLITSKAFGYSTNGTKYDRSSAVYQEPVYGSKIDGFKVICPKNSTAESYAARNGLTAENLVNPLDALNIKLTLKTSSYTYSGAEIRPEYTLTDSIGTNITRSGFYIGSKYTVAYRNNTNAGTASIIAKSNNSSDELTLATFTINKINPTDSSEFKINKIGKGTYNGSMSAPSVEMTYNSVPLVRSVDYIVTAENNIVNGKGKGTIIFLGNYSGSLPIEFDVEISDSPITGFTAEPTDNGTALKWNPISDSNFIFVYRINEKTKESNPIAILSGSSVSYLDTTAPETNDCTYYIQSSISNGGNVQICISDKVTVAAKFSSSEPTLTLGNGKVTVSWNKSAVSGYLVYMDGKQIYDTQSGDVTSYTYTGIRNYERHEFTVKPYTTVDGKTTYGQESAVLSTLGVDSIINSARTTDTRSFTIFNRQGTGTTTSAVTLTDNDIAILDKFARENFTADMTDAQKLKIALTWINRNTTYARTTADFNRIKGKSYVEAIFTYKTGQCAQYNGAMVSMMRYLGYEANLVLGWRGYWGGSYWQHYWGEVEIDGLRYLIETGNYGSSGSWSYLLTPYGRTDGKFIMNCQNIVA